METLFSEEETAAEETRTVAVKDQADQTDRPAGYRNRITVPVKNPESPEIPDSSPALRQDPLITMALPAAAREKTTDLCRKSDENQMKGIALAVLFHVDGKRVQCYI